MTFTARVKFVCWATRETGGQMPPERVRRERLGVELFGHLKYIPHFPRTPRQHGLLWKTIDEALTPTGRVMR